MAGRSSAAALVLALFAGCAPSEPVTQLVVTVDGDPALIATLGRVRASVYAADARDPSAPLSTHDFRLRTEGERASAALSVPFSFAVAQRAEPRLVLVITGYRGQDASEPALIEQKVIAAFEPERARAVDLYLHEACAQLTNACERLDTTCAPLARACGRVKAAPLRPFEPGRELEGRPVEHAPPDAAMALVCPPDHTCPSAYPCRPGDRGYTCVGQRAEWPLPRGGAMHAARYDVALLPGTVRDAVTGLVWQRALPAIYEGCTGKYAREGDGCSWDEAKIYCSTLQLAGLTWRLPTKIELESLVDETVGSPAIDPVAFPSTPPRVFWSSSPSAASRLMGARPVQMWNVDFGSAGALSTYDAPQRPNQARCVSGGAAPSGTPADRYRLEEASDTVSDLRTGLTWRRAQSEVVASAAEAARVCADLPGGFRVPTLKEMLTLIDPARAEPALDPAFAHVAPDGKRTLLWTASSHYSGVYGAYLVSEWSGEGTHESIKPTRPGAQAPRVRCVR